MGSTFYSNNRRHPYAPTLDIKSRLLNRQNSSQKRSRTDVAQNHSNQDKSLSSRCHNVSSQASKVGTYLIFSKNLWNSSLHYAVDTRTRREYCCRVIGLDKYREFLFPYFHIEQHKNINKIVEVLLGETHAYIIFEPSYGDLHSYVRSKRKLKEPEACRLFKQIVQTVSHCHENGIVLRDLKLRKFVFKNKESDDDASVIIKIRYGCKFFMSGGLPWHELRIATPQVGTSHCGKCKCGRTQLKLETFDDAHVTFCDKEDVLTDKHGCPAYVSPEILESTNGYSGKAADIWSLGVMLYTMLFGRYPFHDNEPLALFSKIRSGHFPLPDSISSKAKCLLRAVLRKDPSERFSSQELLEHPWFHSCSAQTVISSKTDRKSGDQCVPDFADSQSFYN